MTGYCTCTCDMCSRTEHIPAACQGAFALVVIPNRGDPPVQVLCEHRDTAEVSQ